MNEFNKIVTEHWAKIVGKLPDGFFLSWDNHLLSLNYNGPGFMNIPQAGSKKKPETGATFVHAASIFSDDEKERIVNFILKWVERVQEHVTNQKS